MIFNLCCAVELTQQEIQDIASGPSLTVNTSGDGMTVFGAAVGGAARLGALITNADGTTQISGGSVQTIGGQSYAGDVSLGGDVLFSPGDTSVINGATSGSFGLTKAGAGTMTLAGANTYTGATTVAAGTLLVSGSLSGDVQVDSGVLGGTGHVSGQVTADSAGTIAPGLSPGILRVGDLGLSSGSALEIEIGGLTPGNTGSDHDQLDVTGTVTIGSDVTLSTVPWNGYAPSDGDQYTIINNDDTDALVGTFGGLAEGALLSDFLGSGLDATISYTGGTGNDIVIKVLPTTLVHMDGNDLKIEDAQGGDTNDTLTVSIDGANIRVADPNQLLHAGSGAIQVDTNTVDIPLTGVTGEILVTTFGGNDSLLLDFSGGVFGVPVTYNGGDPTSAPGDSLTLSGGSFNTAEYSFTNTSDGVVTLDGSVINYVGLEPISSTLTATDLILNYSNAAETVTLSDAGGGQTTVVSTAGESLTFVNPSGTLTVNTGDGDDAINIASLAAPYPADMVLNGQGSADTININTAMNLGTDKDLSCTAETIRFNTGIITTGGDQTYNGSVLLTEDAVLTGGSVTFMSTVDSEYPHLSDPNLEAYWKLDEGTGSTAQDSSTLTLNQPGTLAGDPQWIVGHAGSALEFDGTDDYVTVGTWAQDLHADLNSALRQFNWITYSFWARIPEGGGGAVMGAGADGGQGCGGLSLDHNNMLFRWTPWNAPPSAPPKDTTVVAGNLGLNPDQWYHVAVTVDFKGYGAAYYDDHIKFYIDGVVVPEADTTLYAQYGPYDYVPHDYYNHDQTDAIGGRLGNGVWQSFNGSLDEVAIYKRVLTQQEIQDVAAGPSLTVNTSGNGVTVFGAAVGGSAPLGALITNADGTTQISGGSVRTVGSQSYADDVSLGGDVVFTPGGTSVITGAISGSYGLTKAGAGTMTLAGANSYTGATTVAAGALLVNGSLSAAVQVDSGVLGGTGTVGGQVTANDTGTIAPGLSPGILSVGDLALSSGSALEVEIGGNTPGNTGGDHDQLDVTGTVTIDADVTLSRVSWNSHTPSDGDQYTIINNDDTDMVVGTFSGLAEGAIISGFLGSGIDATISYVGGTGNDVVITAVPTTLVRMDGHDLKIEDVLGGDTNDTLTLSVNGTNIRVTDPNYPLAAGTGVTQVDANTVDAPLSGILGSIIIDTRGGEDTITVVLVADVAIVVESGTGWDRLAVDPEGAELVFGQNSLHAVGKEPISYDPETEELSIIGYGAFWTGGILADDPVAYYPLGESPGSTTAHDFSGNALHGVYSDHYALLSEPGAQVSIDDSAVRFETENPADNDPANEWGEGGTVLVQDDAGDPKLQIAGDLTIEFWFKRTDDTWPWYHQRIVGKGDTNGGRNYGIWLQPKVPSASAQVIFQQTNGDQLPVQLKSTSAIPIEQWTHVAAVIQGDQAYLYINGQLENQATRPGLPAANSDPFVVGFGPHDEGLASHFPGSVDEVAIFDKALSADRIAEHYDARYARAANMHVSAESLVLNKWTPGYLEAPENVDVWTFSGVAGQQVRLVQVSTSDPGIVFDLMGPDAWIGFDNISADSDLINLPQSGTYRLIVHAPDPISAQTYSFMLQETAQILLTPGSVYSGRFTGSGQAQLFRAQIPPGKSMELRLTNAGQGNCNELYARLGVPPTRGQYDYRFGQPASASQEILVPNASSGDWYVLVYGEHIVTPSDYTLELFASDVLITQVTSTMQGNLVPSVLTIAGGGFDTTTTVELVAPDGTSFAASHVDVDSPSQMTATFAAGTVPAGTYSVRVGKPGSDSDTLDNAFEMIEGGLASLETNLVLPQALGRHALATLYVEYANTGEVAMPAPLLVLRATDRAFLTLDQARIVSGFWTSAVPDGFSDTVQIYATGAAPGFLQPGESVRVPVYYAGLQQPWDFGDLQVDFTLSVCTAEDSTPIDWGALQESVRPERINPETWEPIWANLVAQVGATWGDYVRMLGDNAAYLGRLGQRIVNVEQLFDFEVQQANASLHPLAGLAAAVDAAVPAPGLGLYIQRGYANSITGRNQMGPVGRGWYLPWQGTLEAQPDGTRFITGPGGSQRRFQPDLRSSTYFSLPGDHGILTENVDGSFTLREEDGLVRRFRADGKFDYLEDRNGNRITAGYSGEQLTSLSHSSGQSLQISYNAAGLIEMVTDSMGRVTQYSYDVANEHLLSVERYDGRVTRYTYSSGDGIQREHALLSIEAPSGVRRFYNYDASGRLTRTYVDAHVEQVDFSYDSAGRVSMTDAVGNTRMWFFDQSGFCVQARDPLGNVTRVIFDANRHLTQSTDAAGMSTNFLYDDHGSLTAFVNTLGERIQYHYSGMYDQLSSVVDANGNMTKYTYDNSGNRVTLTYPDGTVERVSYDSLGNLLEFTNREGRAIAFTYNANGHVTRKDYADGSYVEFAYDAHGNLTSASDGTDTTTFEYDAIDQLVRVTDPAGRTLEYSYDVGGRRSQMVNQDGFTVNYSYDPAGRLEILTDDAGSPFVTYSYDAAGRLARKDMGNGTYTTFAYDQGNRLLRLTNYAPGGTVNSQFDYTHDVRGLRTSTTTLDGQWTYEYDATRQLTRAIFASVNPAVPDQDLTYEYDALGNRIRTLENGVTTDYGVNNMNQYTRIGTQTNSYDADGNLTMQTDGTETWTYSYDDENQLIGVTTPEGSWSYEYDPFGNRIASVHDGQRTEYVLDAISDADVVGEYDGAGGLVANYVYGLGLNSRVSGSEATHYDLDALGSVVGLSGSDGAYINSYSYLPFGEHLAVNETVANPFGYIGRFGVMEEDNGLIFMRARCYSPGLGRFISEDPIGFAGGSINLYQYGFNAPVQFVDPSGYCCDGPTCNPQPEHCREPENGEEDTWEYVHENGEVEWQRVGRDENGNDYSEQGKGDDKWEKVTWDPETETSTSEAFDREEERGGGGSR